MPAQSTQPGDPRAQLVTALPVDERRIDVAGVSTAVLVGGDGPPMVLLHGPGESSLWWLRVVPSLVETYRVVVPDLPGHGESTVTDNDLDADGVLAWLDGLIERTCTAPPTLVGHLLGGGIATRYAVERNDRLRSLVLVDAFGLGRFRPSARFALGLLRFVVRPSDGAYHSFLDQCLYDRDGLIARMGDDWEPFLAYNLVRARTPSVRTAMRALMSSVGLPTVPPADLERIAVPTTLIWGRDDRAIDLGTAEDASERYGWPLHVVDDAAVDPKLERPDAFLAALDAALADRAEPARTA